MNDPRQRAPFPHQSSSVDLRGFANSPPAPSSARLQHHPHLPHLAPPTVAGVHGGPGFFATPPPPPASTLNSLSRAANGVANTLGVRMARKTSDTGGDYYDHAKLTTRLHRIQQSISSAPEGGVSFAALPGAQTVKFVLLCTLWYATSAVSSNTGKVIMTNFRFPVTLTIVQFAFVAGLCWTGTQLGWSARLRRPTKTILRGTLPMAAFQVGGHIFSSLAISRVPVSTVHTIKALSPLFTVLAYAMLFGVSYSSATYISLLPLTLGVMLAVSFDISLSNYLGLICAFGSTVVFVSQNIFFKKIMPTSTSAAAPADSPRLDKINLLYFSSGLAFLLMIPIWFYTDFLQLVSLWFGSTPFAGATGTVSSAKIVLYFVINGTVHFAQNLLAFAILSSTSPVTYSIASLVKRIAVICLAIVWFQQPVHGVQAAGIMLTAVGLWMYNNAKRDVDKGEKRMRAVEAAREGILPTTLADHRMLDGRDTPPPAASPIPGYVDSPGFAYLPAFTSPSPMSLHEYKEHASPRPSYTGHFEAVRASARAPNYPPPPRRAEKEHGPYPSPPASTASSPPLPPAVSDLPSPVPLTA